MLLPSHDANNAIRPQMETQPQPTLYKSQKYDAQEWPCVLAQDHNEQDRTVAQHYILRTAFKGDFSAPVRQALDKGSVVLDVGCGPGTWTMEMSTEFPNSTFIGIDCQSVFPRDIKPKNCLFRTCDVTQLPLPFPDNSVDFIFQRDLNWHLLAYMWSPLVKEYLRILKPGGWLELMEPVSESLFFTAVDLHFLLFLQDIETQSSQKLECSMNDKLLYGLTLRQQDPYVARRLSSILAINGFRRVESRFHSLPLGWGSSHASAGNTAKCSAFAAGVASQHMFLLRSLQAWLSSVAGMNTEKYNTYISNLPQEWKEAQTYINWHCATAQKPLK
ncbi:hypothetical protein EC973_005677 [Apophysomyces ossiformis]|uniref:Methyltransferase domain-containing protein n=1 Tax=Apophysomyces ossiformis TaxID=679940 RepID=A0A8H7ES09_9FUNG|nr:hypothetical protein EC973_005677 [Apophysomyces ossiformis]